MKIKIVKNGPYLVTGSVPLSIIKIIENGRINEYQKIGEFPLVEKYELCRCGQTKTPPYCDGSHGSVGFSGKETASRLPYIRRSELLRGPTLDLRDDNRCAYARFCQRNGRKVWDMVRISDNPRIREEAIIAATECPTGRLVVYNKDGLPIEPIFNPSIEMLEDTGESVSGPLYVKGYIPIESADGTIYEVRNRVALCRCGHSRDMPFCDAMHISANFIDNIYYIE